MTAPDPLAIILAIIIILAVLVVLTNARRRPDA